MTEPTPGTPASGPSTAGGRVPDRRIIVVGGVVAGLLLLGGSYLLLGGGGAEPVAEVGFAVPRRAAVAVQPSATPSPSVSTTRRAAAVDPFLAGVTSGSGVAAPGTGDAAPAVPADPTAPSLPGLPSELPSTLPTAFVPPPFVPPAAVPPATVPPATVPPATMPPATVPPTTVPTTVPPTTVPPATRPPTATPASHTLVLTRVSGATPDLRGRFLLDGQAVTVAPQTAFGPDGVVQLVGLEQTPDGWVAVLQLGSRTPVNQPLGKVLRFS